nr:MAG TPA: hypothetical protein [Caudoviricetes sp.]
MRSVEMILEFPIEDTNLPMAHLLALANAAFVEEVEHQGLLLMSPPRPSVMHARRIVEVRASVAEKPDWRRRRRRHQRSSARIAARPFLPPETPSRKRQRSDRYGHGHGSGLCDQCARIGDGRPVAGLAHAHSRVPRDAAPSAADAGVSSRG